MPKEPEANLIQRWQRGERAAFEELVRAWEGPLGRFLQRMVGSTETAQDLLQELFLRVYLNAGKFRDQGEFKPWLYRIALNLARDHARKQARQMATRIDFAAEVASKSPSSDDELSLREESEQVRQALSELPEQLREVVVLRHYEDLSFEAMARMLEVPATTLKSRFQVAMKRLEQQLVEMRIRDGS
jgi:RNA polymerase sigma-70 factor, ECF subfamily